MSKLAFARVLCDVGAHGLKAGQVLEADAELIKQLAKDGSVDPHKEAVAYARQQGAQVVRSAITVAAEQRQAEMDALRIEAAQLDDLKAKATDEATAAALDAKLAALKARFDELAALG